METGIQVIDVDSCLRRNDKNGEVSRTGIYWSGGPPYRLQLTVAKKRMVVNGLKQMRVEKKDLHDEVFLDDRFVLPDFFHDSLILDHAFFQDVTPIRGLAAEF